MLADWSNGETFRANIYKVPINLYKHNVFHFSGIIQNSCSNMHIWT